MAKIQVSTGIDIGYQRSGSGPVLLLIMGTGLDHTCWDAQIEAYRREFDCIAFDNRGTGKTESNGEPLTTELLADDAAALLDALGVEKAHVSGLSLGSCVSQQLALRRPELVRTLQLHGTWARAHGYAARKFQAQIRLLELLDLRSFYEINVLWFITPQFMDQHAERLDSQIDSIVEAAPSNELLKQQYLADLHHDTLDRLHEIRVPTLVTVGSFDLALPPMYSREVADLISSAELKIFDDGGHLHNVEQPEEFNRVTLEFLRRNG